MTPETRLMQDLHVDSLDVVELIMAIEDAFNVSLPDKAPDPIYKQLFTRPQFCMRDFAELVYIRQGCGPAQPWLSFRKRRLAQPPATAPLSFSQLGGRVFKVDYWRGALYAELGAGRNKLRRFRRATDGMECLELPDANVEIGSDHRGSTADEAPAHTVPVSRFLVDVEPVSTSAFSRFLNSAGPIPREILEEWFLCTEKDKRREHELIRPSEEGWRPVEGAERFPMMLVSWYGANAYSLWANRLDWTRYRDEEGGFLPTEAQWEYAAHGPTHRTFPWGEDEPTSDRMRQASHEPGQRYQAPTLPLADVNERLGVSRFGLRHMAGNVWQWCRDSYCSKFYGTSAASERDAICREPTGVKVERGGSWIGPAFLCRTTYRRGRPPPPKAGASDSGA